MRRRCELYTVQSVNLSSPTSHAATDNTYVVHTYMYVYVWSTHTSTVTGVLPIPIHR
jgi:hypothetical protein